MLRKEFMLAKRIILLLFTGILGISLFTSCNDFLDEVPDNRTEIDSKVKAQELLVSAYPKGAIETLGELMSDNVTDNGPLYGFYNRSIEEYYRWENVTPITQDTPYYIWNYCYNAIAAANHVLAYVERENDPDLNSLKGEALICRAYTHFILVNVFCQHFNKETSSTDLGIPYIEDAEMDITAVPSRGSVKEVYEKINRDIEEGLPLIDDNAYQSNVIKYHFNKKASHAFAARFNLYYENYDNVIKYSTIALGTDPASVLRNFNDYKIVTSAEDIAKLYVRPSLECNLLLSPAMSWWPFSYQYGNFCRFVHNNNKTRNETYWAPGPWGSTNNFIPGDFLFGSDQLVYFPKYTAFWEILDVVTQSGYMHIVTTTFTTDETLLTRAEAYIMKQEYEKATADLKIWYDSHTTTDAPVLTEEKINDYYSTASSNIAPEINPKFVIEEGKQTNFAHCILHFRRCETVHQGLRWFDIKRYGLQVVHPIYGGEDLILKPHDLRKAIQIPDAVIGAGLEANPR